jgi:Uncharacterised nucleotidyltransferase
MKFLASSDLLPRILNVSSGRDPAERLGRMSMQDWDALVAQAEIHQVAPLLFRHFQKPEQPAAVPAAVMERLATSHQKTTANNEELFSHLAVVLTALREECLPVIALKGVHLAPTVYGDIALRPMRDVDLLAKGTDLQKIEEKLLGLGYHLLEIPGTTTDYSTHRHLAPFIKEGAPPIELHRTIDNSGRFRFEMEDLWKRARPLHIAGVEVLALSPEDLLLHLCLHAGVQHGFRVPLKHIYDIAAMIQCFSQELDWRKLVEAAELWGMKKAGYYALAVAQDLLGAPVPAEALAGLKTLECDDRMVTVIRDYVLLQFAYPAPSGIGAMVRARGSGERLRALIRSVFPPLARLREIYALQPGSRIAYGYYLFRPWDLLARRGSFLLQLASRDSGARLALSLEKKASLIRQQLEEPPVQARGSGNDCPGNARGLRC